VVVVTVKVVATVKVVVTVGANEVELNSIKMFLIHLLFAFQVVIFCQTNKKINTHGSFLQNFSKLKLLFSVKKTNPPSHSPSQGQPLLVVRGRVIGPRGAPRYSPKY
jgi:hypothetical protein